MRIHVPPSRKPPEAPSVQEWLDRHAGIGALAGQALQLADWDRALKRSLPPALHAAITVVGVKYADGSSTLHLLTGSSAAAARLRQMQPTVLADLQQQGRFIDALRIRIKPGSRPAYDHDSVSTFDRRSAPQRRITPAAVASMQKLGNELPEGKLKDAIRALLAHHGANGAPRP